MRKTFAALIAIAAFAWGHAAQADRLVLKSGTTLEGTVLLQERGYWIKTADGQTQVIDREQVASYTAGASQAPHDRASARGGAAFIAARARAQQVESPLAAVAIWQEFVDRNPQSADLPDAQTELKNWKALADAGAEKINGKWLGGEALKQLKLQASQLSTEGFNDLSSKQTIRGVAKLEEAAKLYPNSPRVNFVLGNLAMQRNQYDQALAYFQTNARLRPDSAQAFADVGVAYAFKHQWQAAVAQMQKAVEIEDSKEIAQDLVDLLALMPPAARTGDAYKAARDSAQILASRYSITKADDTFTILPVKEGAGSTASAVASATWSGTGFLISSDGLILTNRHVAKDARSLLVVTDAGLKSAQVVAVDDEQDLAIVRIASDSKLPFLHLSEPDEPEIGAESTVLGYPLIDKLGADLKVTRGIVSSSRKSGVAEADIMVDAKVNPGNSGGPILDQHANVMAIVCMKSVSSATEDSYGIGISAGHIRQFLEKNKITLKRPDATDAMDTEHVVASARSAVVCILATGM